MGEYGPTAVYLGQNEVLGSTKYGDKGTESTGFRAKEISDLDADYSNTHDEAYAEVANNCGNGSLTAWAYIGHDIEVKDDSGEQDATFTFRGELGGRMDLDGGSNYVKATLTVEDQTDNEKYDERLYTRSDYIGSFVKDLTDSVIVPLEAGHYYGVKAEVLAEVTVSSTTSCEIAASDFHRDGNDGWFWWNQVDIEF